MRMGIRDRFKKLPMQKKMMLSFAVPVVVSCILVNLLCFPFIFHNYERQLKYSVNQSCTQAQNYMKSYVENMHYISELLIYNPNIHKILSSDQFGHLERLDQQYREYWELNTLFLNIEQANAGYRVGLYIPDRLVYAKNEHFFYPESSLKERNDYEALSEALDQGEIYFSVIEERAATNPSLPEEHVALFRKSRLVAPSGEERSFIWKVEVSLSDLQTVLANASSTQNSLVYLLGNLSTKMLAVSDPSKWDSIRLLPQLPQKETLNWEIRSIDNSRYYVVSRPLEKYGWQIHSLIPVNAYHNQSRFLWMITLAMTASLSLVVCLIAYQLSRYYTKRLSLLRHKMEDLKGGDFNASLQAPMKQSADEMDAIYENFNYMAEEIRRLLKEHYRLGKHVMSAELKALQAQINPHFLYNTLDLINWGAMDYGADQVARMARDLGQFYRISLNKGKNAIRIEDEIRHVEAYVSIENVHFEERIHLEVNIPDDIRELACLNLILQPFVENSIMHGIAEYADLTDCRIRILAVRDNKDLCFIISDNGKGIEPEKLSFILGDERQGEKKGYGVKNINFRLKLCYGDSYGLTYESTPGNGTTVFVKIPAMTFEELEEHLK